MKIDLKSSTKNFLKNVIKPIIRPRGPLGIKLLGHQNYIGGKKDFDEYGEKLFQALLNLDIKKNSITFDLGCGCLRIGRFLIEYLEQGNYFGLEPEEQLIEYGLKNFISSEIFDYKNPQFTSNYNFDVSVFGKKADIILINSIFTHLNKNDILKCLRTIKNNLHNNGRIFATFIKTNKPQFQLLSSHNHRNFYYTIEEMENFGKSLGLKSTYLGNNWGHPRYQELIIYTKE